MRYFRAEISKDLAFSRASEWMLDNFYVVEQTLHQIEEDLPESYYDQLPKLDKYRAKGIPTHFWIGLGMGRIQPESPGSGSNCGFCTRLSACSHH